MAEVYRARLIEPETDPALLAIKVMRANLASEPRFIEMFRSEGELALMLDSSSIVRTLELGNSGGNHYIAMEYLGGQDLVQVLRRCQETNQRLPIPHAIFIATQLVRALDYAHQRSDSEGRRLNIVNRDVSPSNVRLTYEGGVRILDFGIAQGMKFTSEIGILKGKFSYMSPEQIRGMPLDSRSDVFSAGIILHEMLSTEKLFRGDTEFALMENVRKAEVARPSEFNPEVTAELDEITLRALARDVGDRYQSANEMLVALENELAKHDIDSEEMSTLMQELFADELVSEIRDCQLALSARLSDVEAQVEEEDDDDDEPDTKRDAPFVKLSEEADTDEALRVRSAEVPPTATTSERPKKNGQPAEEEVTQGSWSGGRRRKS